MGLISLIHSLTTLDLCPSPSQGMLSITVAPGPVITVEEGTLIHRFVGR
jgi:hypothetical protein